MELTGAPSDAGGADRAGAMASGDLADWMAALGAAEQATRAPGGGPAVILDKYILYYACQDISNNSRSRAGAARGGIALYIKTIVVACSRAPAGAAGAARVPRRGLVRAGECGWASRGRVCH